MQDYLYKYVEKMIILLYKIYQVLTDEQWYRI